MSNSKLVLKVIKVPDSPYCMSKEDHCDYFSANDGVAECSQGFEFPPSEIMTPHPKPCNCDACKEKNPSVEDFIGILQDFAAQHRSRGKEIGAAVKRNHRTHQQSIVCLIYGILESLSTEYELGNYDARNEQAMRAARFMVKAAKENKADFFPYI